VALVYDRRGRATTVTNGSAVCAFAYNDANQLLIETNSAGTLAGLWVTNIYDNFRRRASLSARNTSTPLLQHSFGNDGGSRLTCYELF